VDPVSTIDGDELLASCPGLFPPGERAPGIQWIGVWVGPRAGLEAVEEGTSVFQAHSPSLYQLSYPGSHVYENNAKMVRNKVYWVIKKVQVSFCLFGRSSPWSHLFHVHLLF
jgi:hypothetical protein